jgi:hypothetical protein
MLHIIQLKWQCSCYCTCPFEGSLPWFESKLNLTCLEYLPYTYFEQVLRNFRSEPDQEVLVVYIRSRLWTINCSSLEINMFFWVWGLWLVFGSYQISALQDAMPHRGKETVITLGFTPPHCPGQWLWSKEHLPLPYYIDHHEWNLLHKHWPLFYMNQFNSSHE